MGRAALCRGDQDAEQHCQIGRSLGVVGPAGGLERVYLVDSRSFAGQDEGERQYRRAGVAVLERVEEEDVEVGAGGA